MNDHSQPPIETDPLGAIRKELLSAAWRKKAADDRRRRVIATVSAMLVSLACVAGGAGAVGVDVPLIGDALHSLSALNEGAEKVDGNGEADPSEPKNFAKLKPGAGNSTESLAFPWGNGRMGAAAAYLNTEDRVCFVIAGPSGEASGGGCMSPAALTRQLDDGVAYLLGVASPGPTVATGYVSSEIEDVAVRGPQGRFDVRMSAGWTPDVAGAATLRAFVATRANEGGGGAATGTGDEVLDRRNYVIEGHLADGRTVTVRP
jgi:hypothetical protein